MQCVFSSARYSYERALTPTCGKSDEHMVSLFQLNQHLDDAHSERNTAHSFASHAKSKSRVKKETAKEADENDDDVRDSLTQWFKKTQKNFQKMSAALLDLPMESPDSDLPSATSSKGSTGGPSSSAFSGVRERVLRRSTSVTPSSHADPASPSATPSGTQETPPSIASLGFSYFSSTKKPETHSRAPSTERGSEPGITKAHWQRESASDMCSEFTCNKSVGIIYGKLNCYLCVTFSFCI